MRRKGDEVLDKSRRASIGVRLDVEMVARVDALIPLYNTMPGRKPLRADALRACLLAGVEAEEKRMAEGGAHGR